MPGTMVLGARLLLGSMNTQVPTC